MLRWRGFAGGSNHPTADAAQATPAPVVSPDTKRFGLENFGNTCYANSVIQALYFCAPFRDLLIQAPDLSFVAEPIPPPPVPATLPIRRKPERKPSTSNANDILVPAAVPGIPSAPPSLFSALRSLFVYISTNPAEKGTVAPRAFIDKLKEFNELFRSTMHQDAHEFLNYLLNKIVEEIEEQTKTAESGSATPSGDDALPAPKILAPFHSGAATQNPTLVHKLFEGILTSETRCLTCENVSSRDESFLDLSIDIEQNASVTACLRQFSASEMLCQKNKFFCDVCCDLQEAEKRMKIKKLPNVLALHLKRFKYQEDVQKYIKLAYRVAFPFELRLFNTVDDIDDADRLFSLFGIVVHIGNGPHHGHYISIIKTMGSWLVFDDENVYPITEADIPKYFGESNSGSAYVLYYQAVDIDLPALGLRPPPSPVHTAEELESLSSHLEASTPEHPSLPPGLVEEPAELSDTSDSVVPVTPPSPSDSRQPIDVVTSSPGDEASPAPTHGLNKMSSKFFNSMRRTPSTSARPSTAGTSEVRYSAQSNGAVSTLSVDDDSRPLLPGSASPPPPVPPLPKSLTSPNGKDKEKDKAKKEEKEKKEKQGGWFGKRRSFKLDKRRSELVDDVQVPPSPGLSSRTPETVSQTSSSSTWFLTSGHTQDKNRRPSDSVLLETGSHTVSPAKTRPKSTGSGLAVRPERDERSNGYDSPSPGSASSSFVSVAASASASAQHHNVVEFPPARTTSLAPPHPVPPSPPPPLPDPPALPPLTIPTKKSMANLTSPKTKTKGPPPALPGPRPSTAGAAEPRPLPKPPVPVPPVPLRSPTLHSTDSPEILRPSINGTEDAEALADLPTSPALETFAGANHSTTSSTGTGASRRASRKMSLTSTFGFGKKDKEKLNKDDKSPSSFRFGK
ncbi:USP domain-containing protein [Mycena chlorophos]|uniref:Ubiquitin carboxyl-terminal hydrolase n=1 Tax=Mycena chlorophos TaxID=658473 RepID=A0A8H6SNR8_MYCCL|nr:USP domain-containing protein [Mycena chlorophos]